MSTATARKKPPAPRNELKWTEEARTRLCALFYDEDKTQLECAKLLSEEYGVHVSIGAVNSQLRHYRHLRSKGPRSGTKVFPWDEQSRADLRRLFCEEKRSQQYIAKALSKAYNAPLTASAVSSQIYLLRNKGEFPREQSVRVTPPVRSLKNVEKAERPLPPAPPPVVDPSNIDAPLKIDGAARTVQTIRRGECKFIYGDPRGPYAYCGRPVIADTPWCAGHHRKCTRRRGEKEEDEAA